jgi:hypothetical protein
MHLNPDLTRQAALDRQQRLQAEAAASRLAGSAPRSRRLARFLRRAAGRRNAAAAPCAPADGAVGIAEPC